MWHIELYVWALEVNVQLVSFHYNVAPMHMFDEGGMVTNTSIGCNRVCRVVMGGLYFAGGSLRLDRVVCAGA